MSNLNERTNNDRINEEIDRFWTNFGTKLLVPPSRTDLIQGVQEHLDTFKAMTPGQKATLATAITVFLASDPSFARMTFAAVATMQTVDQAMQTVGGRGYGDPQ